MNAVGSHIKKLRKQRNLSQEALAEKLNVTRQAVSQWENGNTQPDIDTLERIANVFGVGILEVIYGEKRKAVSQLAPQQRKRYWVGMVGFGVLALIVGVISLIINPQLRVLTSKTYNVFPYLIFNGFAGPLFYIAVPVAVLCGGSLAWDIRVRHGTLRKIMLTASVALMLLYCAGGIAVAFLHGSLEIPFFVIFMMFMIQNPVIFLLPGIGLFLGLNRRRTIAKVADATVRE